MHTLPDDLKEKATDSWALALRTVFFLQIVCLPGPFHASHARPQLTLFVFILR